MTFKSKTCVFALLVAVALSHPISVMGEEGGSHKVLDAVVAHGAGGLMVRTPQGATYQLNEGTPVTVELNEAGTVIDLHRADPDPSQP
jgi:hypothetical protein